MRTSEKLAVCVRKPSHARKQFQCAFGPERRAHSKKCARKSERSEHRSAPKAPPPDRPPYAPPRPRQAAGNAPRTPPSRPSKHHPNRGVTNRRSIDSEVNGSGLSKLARIAKRSAKRLRRLAPRFAGLTRPSCPRGGGGRSSGGGRRRRLARFRAQRSKEGEG